jgi:hypothetical protein
MTKGFVPNPFRIRTKLPWLPVYWAWLEMFYFIFVAIFQGGSKMSSIDENKEVVRRIWEGMVNNGEGIVALDYPLLLTVS